MTPEHHWLESTATYVLGALPEDERRAYEAHLAGCAECRGEVDSLASVTAALAASAPPVTAPPELRDRIMGTVMREAELLQAAGPDADAPEPPKRRWWHARGLRPVGALAGAAAAAAVGFAIGAAVQGTEKVVTRTVAVKVAPGTGPARAAIEVGRQRAILRVQGFPGPGRHRVYQVWVQPTKSSKPIPTGDLFTVGRDGRGEVQLPASARRAFAVYVSSEPEGGNRTGTPSRTPVISGSL